MNQRKTIVLIIFRNSFNRAGAEPRPYGCMALGFSGTSVGADLCVRPNNEQYTNTPVASV
jgi:hypothetical protein